jgi:hypothetical protein
MQGAIAGSTQRRFSQRLFAGLAEFAWFTRVLQTRRGLHRVLADNCSLRYLHSRHPWRLQALRLMIWRSWQIFAPAKSAFPPSMAVASFGR